VSIEGACGLGYHTVSAITLTYFKGWGKDLVSIQLDRSMIKEQIPA